MKRGLREPAEKMGVAFAEVKFDLNETSSMPLSAFSAAMSKLIKFVERSGNLKEKIKDDIKDALVKEDVLRVLSIMPVCEVLFTAQYPMRRGSRVRVRF